MALLVDGKVAKSEQPQEILTEDSLKDVYGANVLIQKHGDQISIIRSVETAQRGIQIVIT